MSEWLQTNIEKTKEYISEHLLVLRHTLRTLRKVLYNVQHIIQGGLNEHFFLLFCVCVFSVNPVKPTVSSWRH